MPIWQESPFWTLTRNWVTKNREFQTSKCQKWGNNPWVSKLISWRSLGPNSQLFPTSSRLSPLASFTCPFCSLFPNQTSQPTFRIPHPLAHLASLVGCHKAWADSKKLPSLSESCPTQLSLGILDYLPILFLSPNLEFLKAFYPWKVFRMHFLLSVSIDSAGLPPVT